MFGYHIRAIHDEEFFDEEGTRRHRIIPFSLKELSNISGILRDIVLGLIEIAFPESRFSMTTPRNDLTMGQSHIKWLVLYRSSINLLKQLHIRDTRRNFCPEGHWTLTRRKIILPAERIESGLTLLRSKSAQRPFRATVKLKRHDLGLEGPPMTTREIRVATILKEVPFIIDFSQRLQVFSNILFKERELHQGDRSRFLQGPSINISVRRNFIYEDSFEKLTPKNGKYADKV